MIAGMLSTALNLWSDPDIARLTADNTLDIEALRREKTVIYLVVDLLIEAVIVSVTASSG